MANCYLDIETLPGPDKPDVSSVKVPANYKDEAKIKAYQEEHLEEEYRRQSLDSMKGEILCIGYALDDAPVEVICFDTEYETLCGFQNVLKTAMGQYSEPVQFIGWGNRNFDMPFLWRKAIKYQLTALKKAINRDRRGNILDLMEIWSAEYRDYRKLDDVAKFLGIPGKEGMNGSQVYGYYLKGRIEEITLYCQRDVEIIREINNKIYE